MNFVDRGVGVGMQTLQKVLAFRPMTWATLRGGVFLLQEPGDKQQDGQDFGNEHDAVADFVRFASPVGLERHLSQIIGRHYRQEPGRRHQKYRKE